VEFELVAKYRNKLLSYAYKYDVPPEDVFQEARIIEWRLEKYSPLHKISYFLDSCKYQTLKLAHFGVVSLDELEVTKTLTVSENFDRWYDLYIWELSDMFNKIDEVLCEMFLMKVAYNISWSAMRKKKFETLPCNIYWDNIKYIKYVVKDYVKEEQDLPFLELVEV
jgi:hypothetical protein